MRYIKIIVNEYRKGRWRVIRQETSPGQPTRGRILQEFDSRELAINFKRKVEKGRADGNS